MSHASARRTPADLHTVLARPGYGVAPGSMALEVGVEGARQAQEPRTAASTKGDTPDANLTASRALNGHLMLTLPYPPTMNHLYVTGKDGRRHLSRAGRQFTAQVAQLVTAWRWQQTPILFPYPLGGRLVVTITAYPPDRRRRDIQNLDKIVLDALEKARLYANDSQIDELHVYRGPQREVACVEVTIHPKGESHAP